MTQLVWGQEDQKHYETGVDHGVLYIGSNPGVVWNGLISVNESSESSEASSYYLDGIKYLDRIAPRDFQAKIDAFSVPPEFAECVGERTPRPGFILTRQPRLRFGLTYQTRVDGDVGYKIHLVYNALASPTGRSYISKSSSPSLSTFSWDIDAIPEPSTTHRPTAHYIIDSTKINSYVLTDLESFLYGNAVKLPKLPTQEQAHDIINNVITEPLTEPI